MEGLYRDVGEAGHGASGTREISGQALDVAPDGALLLRTANGETVRVTSGEITP